MQVVRQYKTKAAWDMYADAAGLPYLGYYGDYWLKRAVEEGKYAKVPEKTNILLHGSLMLTGTARGRSAAHFNLKSPEGWEAHMTMVGTAKLLEAVSKDEMLIHHDRWLISEERYDSETGGPKVSGFSYEGAVVTGYWTVAKQGTEVSLIPAPSAIITDQARNRD